MRASTYECVYLHTTLRFHTAVCENYEQHRAHTLQDTSLIYLGGIVFICIGLSINNVNVEEMTSWFRELLNILSVKLFQYIKYPLWVMTPCRLLHNYLPPWRWDIRSVRNTGIHEVDCRAPRDTIKGLEPRTLSFLSPSLALWQLVLLLIHEGLGSYNCPQAHYPTVVSLNSFRKCIIKRHGRIHLMLLLTFK